MISLIFIIIVIITFTLQRQKGKKRALIFDCSTKKDYLSAVILKSQRRLKPHWCKSGSSCLLALCFSTQWVGRLKTEEKFLSPVPIGFVMVKWTRPLDCHHFFVFTFLALIVNYFSRCARGRDYFCHQCTHLHMYNFLASNCNCVLNRQISGHHYWVLHS